MRCDSRKGGQMKSDPDINQGMKRSHKPFVEDNEKKHKWVRLLMVVVSILLLAAGLWRDEAAFVMRRAISICLECIGIG